MCNAQKSCISANLNRFSSVSEHLHSPLSPLYIEREMRSFSVFPYSPPNGLCILRQLIPPEPISENTICDGNVVLMAILINLLMRLMTAKQSQLQPIIIIIIICLNGAASSKFRIQLYTLEWNC
jgi:hypothetical protein